MASRLATDDVAQGGDSMKYGFPEEDDISDVYRKMAKEGAQWGCIYLNGFLESINVRREPDRRFTVLVRTPGECDFCDFVFAVGNRICAVVFDIYSWGSCLLTYERRMKLAEHCRRGSLNCENRLSSATTALSPRRNWTCTGRESSRLKKFKKRPCVRSVKCDIICSLS